jgi:hypothetical protein
VLSDWSISLAVLSDWSLSVLTSWWISGSTVSNVLEKDLFYLKRPTVQQKPLQCKQSPKCGY